MYTDADVRSRPASRLTGLPELASPPVTAKTLEQDMHVRAHVGSFAEELTAKREKLQAGILSVIAGRLATVNVLVDVSIQ